MSTVKFVIAMASWLIVFATTATILAQKTDYSCNGWKRIPSELVTFLYLDQKELNVDLGRGQVLVSPGNEMVLTVEVRNRSGKSIRAVGLDEWHLGGGSAEWLPIDVPTNNRNQEFRIGANRCESVPELSKSELESRRLPKDRLVTVIVFGIRKIWYEDGTLEQDTGIIKRFDEFAQRIQLEEKK